MLRRTSSVNSPNESKWCEISHRTSDPQINLRVKHTKTTPPQVGGLTGIDATKDVAVFIRNNGGASNVSGAGTRDSGNRRA